jgi:hypothetical protein
MMSIGKSSIVSMSTNEVGFVPSRFSPPPARYVKRALDIFSEYDLKPPDQTRVETLVHASMEAQHLLLTASLIEPTSAAFGAVFDAFVSYALGLDIPEIPVEV